MKPFSLLIKPASADCNLACDYCFYLPKSALYPHEETHRMSERTLDKVIRSYMATPQPQYVFGWQGGEPTLMGVDFFRAVTSRQQKYGRAGMTVANGLQTNATLIDDEFAAHIAAFNFLVGVSLDGPADIHDRYRKSPSGAGAHADVLRGIQHLRERRVEFNTLTLVTAANESRATEVYTYLCEKGFFHHQYIPCVEFDDRGRPRDFAVTPEGWGDFLSEVFDLWLAADTRRVSVRLFDSILAYLVDGTRNECTMGRDCRLYFLIEYSGDAYPCDFFAERPLRLGNVMKNSWDYLQASPVYREFGMRKSAFSDACRECEFIEFCAGGCTRHRRASGGSAPHSHLCPGLKRFYAHALPRLRPLAAEIIRERQRTP